MPDDILLARTILPPGWIDTSYGEAYTVKKALFDIFHPPVLKIDDHALLEYGEPTGHGPLVRLLEDKYQAPVVITNGAKQALGATFYALHKMGHSILGMRTPYWALIPPLAKMHGLECEDEYYYVWDSFLAVSPNNPDGSLFNLQETHEYCRNYRNLPLIHDAAYYTHTYLPKQVELKAYGDVQIYSASKMFGLSGIRLGWAVCPNHNFYRYIQEYMEAMTVGVSILPQMYVHDILQQMQRQQDLQAKFEQLSFDALYASKKLATLIDPQVLQVPADLPDTPGMFGFFKTGPKFDPQAAKINFAQGEYFGAPGHVRMNMAFNVQVMEEIVQRLNQAQQEAGSDL